MTSDVDLMALLETVSDPVQRDYIMKEFTKHEPGLNKVRSMIVARTCYSSEVDDLDSIFPDNSSLLFADSNSAQARSQSTYLKLAFMDRFYEYLDRGKGEFSLLKFLFKKIPCSFLMSQRTGGTLKSLGLYPKPKIYISR
jgi:hypothetical protein